MCSHVCVCMCVCVCVQDVESVLDFVAAGSLGTGRVDVTKIALWGYCYSGELCVFACVCVCVCVPQVCRIRSLAAQSSLGLYHMLLSFRWAHDLCGSQGTQPRQGERTLSAACANEPRRQDRRGTGIGIVG